MIYAIQTFLINNERIIKPDFLLMSVLSADVGTDN